MGRDAQALGEAVVRVAERRQDLTLITGPDPRPLDWFADMWPSRVLTVPPPQARMAVAEGVVRAGAQAVVVLEPSITDLPAAPEVGVLMVSAHPGHVRAAHRAGVAIVQPGWVEDLPALVRGALRLDRPVVLHLPDLDALSGAATPPDPPALPLDGPRVLRRGREGVVIGAGPTARVASWVGSHLVGRRRQVTVLDLVLITPESDVDAALLATHLLVGPADSPRAAAMAAVPVADQPLQTAERVLAALDA